MRQVDAKYAGNFIGELSSEERKYKMKSKVQRKILHVQVLDKVPCEKRSGIFGPDSWKSVGVWSVRNKILPDPASSGS